MKNIKKGLTIFACMFLLMTIGIGSTHATLVASYSFTGNAYDESGNENHGTVYGSTLSADRFGNPDSAYFFDGQDDYILVNDHNLLDLTDDFALSFWINPASKSFNRYPYGDSFNILSKHRQHTNDDGSWFIKMRDGDVIEFQATPLFDPTSPRSNSGIISIAEWNHVVFTYNDSTDKWFLYINNQLDSFGTEDLQIANTDKNLYIGKEEPRVGNDPFNQFEGMIDDIYIYNHHLTNSEIQDLYGTQTLSQHPGKR